MGPKAKSNFIHDTRRVKTFNRWIINALMSLHPKISTVVSSNDTDGIEASPRMGEMSWKGALEALKLV